VWRAPLETLGRERLEPRRFFCEAEKGYYVLAVRFVVDEFRRVHIRKDALRVLCCSVRCVTDNNDMDTDRLRRVTCMRLCV
jgi:hypothetical protein